MVNKVIFLLLCIISISTGKVECQGVSGDAAKLINTLDAPKIRFAVIADIQYGDKETAKGRYYRTSLDRLVTCINDLNTRNLSMVVQMGDIIDGHRDDMEKTHEDLTTILKVLGKLTAPVYHVIGNHDLVADQKHLYNVLGLDRGYYDFTSVELPGWRMVVLDGNDGGYGIMKNHQIEWFENTLEKAFKNNEKVLCFSHFALLKSAANNHRMAEAEPVLNVLDKYDNVVAWFAGHDHSGGYAYRNKVHHLTFKGMVEAPELNSYALIEVYADRMIIIGVGKEESRELVFDH